MPISTDLHLYLNREKFIPELCSSVNIVREWKQTKDFIYMSSKIKEEKWEITICTK